MTLAGFIALSMALVGITSRWGEKIVQFVTLIGISLPTLFVGPLIIYLFGFYLGWFPVALLEGPMSYVLPIIVIALRPASSVSRILFSSLKNNLKSDDLRTARSFGISEMRIALKYNLRKSIIPAASYLLGTTGAMMGGALMVEILFALPGLGSRFLDAVLNRDASLVIGLTLSYGIFIFLFQMLTDILVILLDPRIKRA
jgi:oligopeptide transport system permease protein